MKNREDCIKPRRLGGETLDTIRDLHENGISRMSVLMRHSARHFDTSNWANDPLMELTEKGKAQAYAFGKSLPADLKTRLFSSPVHRCIETAALIGEGHSAEGGSSDQNEVLDRLAAFFAVDFVEAIEMIGRKGYARFFRDWFNGHVPAGVMGESAESAGILLTLMADKLEEVVRDCLDVHVTHDWCLYLVKEIGLGLALEDFGEVGYLEGVILYPAEGRYFMTNHQTDPKEMQFPLRSEQIRRRTS